MERIATKRVGVLIERRATGNAWQEWSWSASAVIPHADGNDGWRVLRQGNGRSVFHAGPLTLELHFRETEAYLHNLDRENPAVYVALRPSDHAGTDRAVEPFFVTISPDEAEACATGDTMVSPVPMPGFIAEWASRFVAAHHSPAPFERRPRKGDGSGAGSLSPAPGSLRSLPLSRTGWGIPGRRHG